MFVIEVPIINQRVYRSPVQMVISINIIVFLILCKA